MFKAIIIILKCISSVVRRIDIYALHLPPHGRVRLQRLQRQQVVPMDQQVVEDVAIAPRLGMVRKLRIFEQDARFQPGTDVLANPGEFELGFGGHHTTFT